MVDLISSAKSVISTNAGLVISMSPGNWRPVLPVQHCGRAFPSWQALRTPFGEAAPPPHALILFRVLLSTQQCHRAHLNCTGNPAGLPISFASAYWFHLTSAVRPHPAAYFKISTHLSAYVSEALSATTPLQPKIRNLRQLHPNPNFLELWTKILVLEVWSTNSSCWLQMKLFPLLPNVMP